MPIAIVELAVHVAPLLTAVVISLLRVTPATLRTWTSAPFAGLSNYRLSLSPGGPIGSELWGSIARTLAYAAVVVPTSWCLGLLAALVMAEPFRGQRFFHALFLIPFALPAFATVISWRLLFDHDSGLLNTLLVDDLHLLSHRPFWLIGGNAFWVTTLVATWRLWPFAYFVLAAALRSAPAEPAQAARVDGANAWQLFRHVTLPAIRPAARLSALLMTAWTVTDFSTPFLLFNGQPPPAAQLFGPLAYRTAFVDLSPSLAGAMNLTVTAAVTAVAGVIAWRMWPKGDA